MTILQDLSTMTHDQLIAALAAAKAENEGLKLKASQKGSKLKVSVKGALSLYGMGRWPVTLYKSQWLALLDMADDIRAFIKAHDSELKSKDDED